MTFMEKVKSKNPKRQEQNENPRKTNGKAGASSRDANVSAERGRPAQCTPQLIARAAELCEKFGVENRDLAYCLGVSIRTIQRWLDFKNPQFQEPFAQAVQQARKKFLATVEIERKYATLAVGFEKRIEVLTHDRDGNPVTLKIKKFFPPDERAGRFMLTNWMPERYKNRQDIDAKESFTLRDFMLMASGFKEEDVSAEGPVIYCDK
jgi:hypothetical protein